MAAPISFHVASFSQQVQLMNQTNSKRLTLSAEEARNLHTEIFALLAKIVELTDTPPEQALITVAMDGGGFKS